MPVCRALLSLLISIAAVSCTPQYARMVRYEFNQPYSKTKQQIETFYSQYERKFTLLQDEIHTTAVESSPGARTEYVTRSWAFDIGTSPQFKVVLTALPQGSEIVAKELKLAGAMYDGTRVLTKSKLGNMTKLDAWVQANMNAVKREVGEDTESPPLYPVKPTL